MRPIATVLPPRLESVGAGFPGSRAGIGLEGTYRLFAPFDDASEGSILST